MPLVLSGALVELRMISEDDVEALVAASSESRENYGYAHVPRGVEDMSLYVRAALLEWESGRQLPFVITLIANRKVIGSTRFYDIEPWVWPPGSVNQRSDIPDSVEIGHTWFAHSAQRTGANIESKLLMMTHAFETWNVHRVRLRTDERNIRSREAISKLGAKLDGILRADRPGADDTVRNSVYFSILAAEWPMVKEGLVRRLARQL